MIMKVKDFMTKDVISCPINATLKEAAQIMSEHRISALPIVEEENHLVGIITTTDFVGKEIDIPHALVSIKRLLGQDYHNIDVEEIYKKASKLMVSDVMSSNPMAISPDQAINDVVNNMIASNHKRLPVVENNKLLGIITRKDLIKAFAKLA
jgi:CBS domain-containing protein